MLILDIAFYFLSGCIMINTLTIRKAEFPKKIVLIDLIAISCVYFIPTFSHLLNLPFYLLEPIRIITLLSLIHTRKLNAYILALTLPVFSFAVSGHPVLFKMLIMTCELLANIWLFDFLNKKINNTEISMGLSVSISKLIYYTLQYIVISMNLLSWEQVEHPILPQVIVIFALSGYIYLIEFYRKRKA